MKISLTTKSILALGAVATFAIAAIAGPGPQYWAKPAARQDNANTAPKSVPALAVGCGGCKTAPVLEFVSSLPNGKGTPRWTVVGSKHECGSCGGAITSVRGQTRDTMDHTSSPCAKAAMNCCR